ncbi:hypothetical protein VT930_09590 [Mycobacterium sherrisii]|uniref:hypothetical protein n=1 Tax=Mycobacterium sherrisii TaxID=243061 RepID=UPI002DDDA349|nr:hypothetical protein [Mycobacterium sherrisii]MEC4763356.1 hypothetical protein [Mycobacterium sherrisii]
MSGYERQALCCVCGAIRSCRRPRNHQGENYWLRGPVDRDWHRETGDLKCDHCGAVTRHAIVTGDDHAEDIHKAAIGWSYRALDDEGHQRIREQWRQGLPQNPNLRHIWFISEEERAREAGHTHMPALCGAQIPLPRPEQCSDREVPDEPLPPNPFHDVDYEDPQTGMWWYAADCVDCLRNANARVIARQRKVLSAKLWDCIGRLSKLDARTVSTLVQQLSAIEGGEL